VRARDIIRSPARVEIALCTLTVTRRTWNCRAHSTWYVLVGSLAVRWKISNPVRLRQFPPTTIPVSSPLLTSIRHSSKRSSKRLSFHVLYILFTVTWVHGDSTSHAREVVWQAASLGLHAPLLEATGPLCRSPLHPRLFRALLSRRILCFHRVLVNWDHRHVCCQIQVMDNMSRLQLLALIWHLRTSMFEQEQRTRSRSPIIYGVISETANAPCTVIMICALPIILLLLSSVDNVWQQI
jgi:hypothetical protein